MRTAAFVAALVAGVVAAPQAVTSAIAPNEKAPEGCSSNYDGTFQVAVAPMTKRSVEKRQSINLEVTLKDGVLTDSQQRTGYIASNNQFQFDGPAQAGAIYTAGWTVCQNGSLALGNSAVFQRCLSGTFYNLYDENSAAQCSPIHLQVVGSTSTSTATSVENVICQIGDGQIQHNTCLTTATPVAELPDGQVSAPPAGGAITQISDGQIQAPGPSATGSQPSAPASAPAVTSTPASPVVQPPVVSQISDGQIQAPTNGTGVVSPTLTPTPTPASGTPTGVSAPSATFTGAAAAAPVRVELYGLVAGVVALAML